MLKDQTNTLRGTITGASELELSEIVHIVPIQARPGKDGKCLAYPHSTDIKLIILSHARGMEGVS